MFPFGVNLPAPINLTTHQNTLVDNAQWACNSNYCFVEKALTLSAYHGILDEAVIHACLHTPVFVLNPVDEDTKH